MRKRVGGDVGAGGVQGWAPAAVGTCVAIVFGAGMTGEPALMLAMLGCVLGVIEAMPAVRKPPTRLT